MTLPASGRHGPEHAVERGIAALKAGDAAMAANWFERCWRLAPNDPATLLLCAASLARDLPHRAEALLADAVAEHPDSGAARLALAAVRARLGQHGDAAALLHDYLSRFAPADDPDFPRLASAIALRAHYPGWIGVDTSGNISHRVPHGAAITLMLDGACLPGPHGPVLPDGWREGEWLHAATQDGPLLGSPVCLRTRSSVTGVVALGEAGDLRGWAYLPADPAARPSLHLLTGRTRSLIAPLDAQADDAGPPAGAPRHAFRFQIPQAKLPMSGALRVTGPDGHDLLGSPLAMETGQKAAARTASRLGEALTPSASPDRPTWAAKPAQAAQGPAADAARLPAANAARLPAANAASLPAADAAWLPAADAAWLPMPAACLPPLLDHLTSSARGTAGARRRALRVDVVIPVYRGADDLAACLGALLPSLPPGARVTIVDDGSRDAALGATLAGLSNPRIAVLRHDRNRGFPAAANTGLRHAAQAPGGPRDVVLLNPDVLVQPGWLQRLAKSAYARADIGSVTPATNDGTITAIQARATSAASRAALAAACAAANADHLIEIPAGTGFCLYLRHDCLAAVGLFREDTFAQGYGEETDWCLRARHLGWRHAADMSVFVAHRGGATFGAAGAALRTRNMAILERLHPGANAALSAFLNADALRDARRRIDAARWRAAASKNGAVILITHAEGGGVARHVQARCAQLRAQGLRPILIKPVPGWADTVPAARRCAVGDDNDDIHHLIFQPGRDLDALAALLGPDAPRAIELHHILGHDPSITRLAARLAVPLDIVLHDYALICPRVTLTGAGQTYCGEPSDIADCQACIADHGDRLRAGMPPDSLRNWTASRVREARRVVAPHADVARRIARHIDLAGKLTVQPWEDEAALPHLAAAPKHRKGRILRVCVPGGIGDEKGYAILLACARDAAKRRLLLHFTIAGHTRDDARLMDTGHVFVTGRYAEDEALSVVTAQAPDIGFIPSVWPETWCYALTLLWRAGLWPVSFNIGTQAARIVARGAGTILPLGLSAGRINDSLLGLVAPRLERDQALPVQPGRAVA